MYTNLNITRLQADILLRYSKRKKIALRDASLLFQKYHIFDYLSVCYHYVQHSGPKYIVDDVSTRIRKGEDFNERDD